MSGLLNPVLRPAFIRGLLENIGPQIDPIRLIRRIKNGLEIPGLKGALIKILQDFNLQISLLEGCQTIMHGDSSDLSKTLNKDQTSGFLLSGTFLFSPVYVIPFISR
jgi:vacuolar protein sorting-associated protein 41